MPSVIAWSNGLQQLTQISNFFTVIIQSEKFTVMVDHVQGVRLGQIPCAFVDIFYKVENAFLVEVLLQILQVGKRFQKLFWGDQFDGEFRFDVFSFDSGIEDKKCGGNQCF